MYQSYRNISRHFKQFLYGDKALEEQFLICLRHAYTMRFWIETPIHLHSGGGDRVLADQSDREFELIYHNQHPQQLLLYQVNNQRIQEEVENEAVRASGQKTLEDQFVDFMTQRLAKEKERLGEGHKISHEKLIEIYTEGIRRMRHAESRPVKDLNGEFTDFLEVRRPFIAPNNDSHTH